MQCHGTLLGYDISDGSYSLVTGALLHDRSTPPALPDDVELLLELLKGHFRPLLNEHALFADATTAQICLDCMMALQRMRPGMFEHESVIFNVVGLWAVPV